MRQLRQFEAFGRKYRTTQFAADEAFSFLGQKEDPHPDVLLKLTEAFNETDSIWYSLGNTQNIDIFVTDTIGFIAPRLVLRAICGIVHDFNFLFMQTWKGIRIPVRFQEGSGVTSSHADPLGASLIQTGAASLRELQEFYSLEDAFRMFDVMTAKSLTEALAYEDATKKKR